MRCRAGRWAGLWCVLVVLGSGCHRTPPPTPPPPAPPAPLDVPKATAPTLPPEPPKPETRNFEDIGVLLTWPADWLEGVPPSEAGRGVRLLHLKDKELPAVMFLGIAPSTYDTHRERVNKLGRDPLDDLAKDVLGRAQVRQKSEWYHESLVGLGRRYRTVDKSTKTPQFVDYYIGEALVGGLYVISIAAEDEGSLDDLKPLLDKVKLLGVKEANGLPRTLRAQPSLSDIGPPGKVQPAKSAKGKAKSKDGHGSAKQP